MFNQWGLLKYDQVSGVDSPKKRFYTTAQFFKFILPGSYQISDSASDSSVKTCTFFDPLTGTVTLVGRTMGDAVTLSGTLTAVNSPSRLSYYYTNATADLARGADVAVTNGRFEVNLPADTTFTLTNVEPSPPPTATPYPAGLAD